MFTFQNKNSLLTTQSLFTYIFKLVYLDIELKCLNEKFKNITETQNLPA